MMDKEIPSPSSPISHDSHTLSSSINALVIDDPPKVQTGDQHEAMDQVDALLVQDQALDKDTSMTSAEEHTAVQKNSQDTVPESQDYTQQQDVQPNTDTIKLSSSKKHRRYSDNLPDNSTPHVRFLPRVNCPEKVVFCFNLSKELENPSFKSRSGDKFAPLHLIKRAISLMMKNKSAINSKHQYALIILHHTAHWAYNFTSDPDDIINYLDTLDQTLASDSVNLDSLFDTLHQHVELPAATSYCNILPPPYVVRAILIYGSSYCIPTLQNKKSQQLLDSSPYFFMDAFYIHESLSPENKCSEIFDVICSLDTKGLSYIFEVSRNPTKLHDYMAQLLPHPLQRPLQREAFYELEDLVESVPPLSPT